MKKLMKIMIYLQISQRQKTLRGVHVSCNSRLELDFVAFPYLPISYCLHGKKISKGGLGVGKNCERKDIYTRHAYDKLDNHNPFAPRSEENSRQNTAHIRDDHS